MQRLERGALADFTVLGEVDHAHAAAPELLGDAVLTDALAKEALRQVDLGRSPAGRRRAGVGRIGGVVLGRLQADLRVSLVRGNSHG